MKHMKEKELEILRVLLSEFYSIPQCAQVLGYHKSTLYRILQVHHISYTKRKYRYVWGRRWNRKESQEKYVRDIEKKKIQFSSRSILCAWEERRRSASTRYARIEPWGILEKYILKHIQQHYSSNQISWRWKLETGEKLSKDIILQLPLFYSSWDN